MAKPVIRVAITDDTRILRCRLLVELIRLAGAEPVLLPQRRSSKKVTEAEHRERITALLDRCDALILPGNRYDVPPKAYGETIIHPETERRLNVNPLNVRFVTESHAVRYATGARPLPLLGICGGLHVTNVALGGRLVQHLPDDRRVIAGHLSHVEPSLRKLSKQEQKAWEAQFVTHIRQPTIYTIFPATHGMRIEPDSLLGRAYRREYPDLPLDDVGELSIHHQGCFDACLAPGLRAVAWAPDGVVEAIEYPDHPHFFLLTQFHFECNVSQMALPLVRQLVDAARAAM